MSPASSLLEDSDGGRGLGGGLIEVTLMEVPDEGV